MKKNRRLTWLFILLITTWSTSIFGQTPACNDSTIVTLDETGSVTIYPSDILEGGPYDLAIMQIFNLDTGEGGEFLILDCDDLGTVEVEVKDTSDNSSCWGNLIVEDNIDPTPYAISGNVVSLNGGNSVTITADLIDGGSFDNCEIVSTTLSQYTFTAVGNYNVDLILTDQSGNSDFATVVVTVIEGSPACNDVINISLDPTGQTIVNAEVFVEGSANYDLLEVSRDNVNFGETVTFTCEDTDIEQTVYVHIVDDGEEYNCTTTAFIEDKLAPVVIVNDFTIDLATVSDTYTLLIEDVVQSSFDNCEGLVTTLSQTEFSNDNWGQNSVVVTVTDIAGLAASATSTVTVLINGEMSPLECLGGITIAADPWGGPTLWGVDFVQNNQDFDQVLASLDPAGPFTESFTAPCGINGADPLTVYIQASVDTQQYTCIANLYVIDNTPPVAVAEQTIVLSLLNGEATLAPEMVDDGSFDACTEVVLTLDQTQFTSEDIGVNTVFMTVADLNGNESLVSSTVIVDDGNSCTLQFVIYPDDISLFDENGTIESLTIENLQDIYGYEYEEVYPYTASECANIFYAHTDQEITIDQGYTVLRTWTALDWINEEVATEVQVLQLFTGYNSNLACNNLGSVSIQNGPVTLWPSDVLEGGPYNYDNMILTLEDNEGNLIENNLITAEYIGQTLLYVVTDTSTGNSCFGNVLVEDNSENCLLDEDELNFPLATINIPDSGIDMTLLTPTYLQNNYGYELSEVLPTWPADDCLIVAYSYEDDYFDFGDGTSKIVRDFTIVDWLAYDPILMTGIWNFTQEINIGIDPTTLICDFLPRTADVGDCESGHTLDDDVEWPADIQIADYRLSPDELVEFSMVDILDSEPSFYNDPVNYTAAYQDLVVELTSTTLTIGRVWTVSHMVYGFTWTYTQTIIVDFSEFDNLVTVNTGTNRAMPGVMINDEVSTNMQGITYLINGEVSNIEYEDDFLNGVNLLDLILIHRYILGLESLEAYGILAADINLDGMVKASDLLEMRKRMLGEVTSEFEEWRFYSKEIDSHVTVKPKGAYTGIKAGDVDDSAILQGDEPIETDSKFRMDDILLNIGETYSVPVYLEKEYSLYGIQYRTQLDLGVIDVMDITSDYLNEGFEFYVTDDGVLTLLFTSKDSLEAVGGMDSAPIFTIEFESKANSLLSLAIDHDSRYSYLVNTDLELFVLGGEVGNMIGTGTNSEELSSLSVYPNPTADYLYFDLKDVSVQGNMEVSVYSLNGQKLLTIRNAQQIDVSNLNSGMYYYQIKIDDYSRTGKFVVRE